MIPTDRRPLSPLKMLYAIPIHGPGHGLLPTMYSARYTLKPLGYCFFQRSILAVDQQEGST